mmetsp:Transcript_125439/g.220910  ORF Transcript_125439/g.220910 Transcript_125439/m.220910 type:complete len:292 (+) Transcript_125439:466-1341(+)
MRTWKQRLHGCAFWRVELARGVGVTHAIHPADVTPIRPVFLEAIDRSGTLVLPAHSVRVLLDTGRVHLTDHLEVSAGASLLVQLFLGRLYISKRSLHIFLVVFCDTVPGFWWCFWCSPIVFAFVIAIAEAVHAVDVTPVCPPFLEASPCSSTLVLTAHSVGILLRTTLGHLTDHLPVVPAASRFVQLCLGCFHVRERSFYPALAQAGNTKPRGSRRRWRLRRPFIFHKRLFLRKHLVVSSRPPACEACLCERRRRIARCLCSCIFRVNQLVSLFASDLNLDHFQIPSIDSS